MEIIIAKDYTELSDIATKILAKQIMSKKDSVLGLATGTTPIKLYKNLIDLYKTGEISFKDVKTINLDEYVGLTKNNPQSYDYFMRKNLFDHIDILPENTHIPNTEANSLEEECKNYTELIKSLVPNIQILGIGSNGHIGFNEPGTPFDSHTHIVNLTTSTIKDNSRLFSNIDEVPKQAITMGLADIMSAKKILLLASGKNKARAVFSMIKGSLSENCPASILRKHPNITVIIDKDAGSEL